MAEQPENGDDRPTDLGLEASWERTIEGTSTKERVYAVVTTLTEPTRVATIAERADCSPNGARANLEWFADLGIVERTAAEPALYRRNEAYFAFLRAHRLVQDHDAEALADLLDEYEARDRELAAQFDVEEPAAVEPLAAEAFADFETAYDRLSEWRAVRRRLQDLRRARLLLDWGADSGTVPA